ncbi:hypothetical protein QAD02_023493 [Eretmocerus hayati]|uniref:Uncharacterized protein n=1 Tax=Eretmocerus hayati TaxID=131215 RepID=A0ACC2PVQ6_9HYME|nr:hypothetical protein QAD02_023493 [Eretmocerus hayati]
MTSEVMKNTVRDLQLQNQYMLEEHVCTHFTRADPLSGQNVRHARKDEFPFVTIFSVKDNLGTQKYCSGSLISKRHVLTAAQCLPVLNQSIDKIKICVSLSDKTVCNAYGSNESIAYNEWSKKRGKKPEFDLNDIAIIKLTRDVDETDNVKLASISEEKKDQMYLKTLRLTGWADTVTKPTKDDQPILQTTAVKVMTNEKCELMNYKRNVTMSAYIQKVVLCTYADPYTVLDNVDVGGPLLHDERVVGVNVGKDIISLAHHDEETTVNMHMSTDYYRDFIHDVISVQNENAIPQIASNNSLQHSQEAHKMSSNKFELISENNGTESSSTVPTVPKIHSTAQPEISGSSKNDFVIQTGLLLVTLLIIAV